MAYRWLWLPRVVFSLTIFMSATFCFEQELSMCNVFSNAQRDRLEKRLLLIGFALFAIGPIVIFALMLACGALVSSLPIEEGGFNSHFALVARIAGVAYLVCILLASSGAVLVLFALATWLKGLVAPKERRE